MSANSGVAVSPQVSTTYAEAATNDARFIVISIQAEELKVDQVVPRTSGAFDEDLANLGSLLDDKLPSFVLARLDEDNAWLFISYVPENASVRNKMLYASSRSALTRALGDQKFKDTLFATTKDDLTPASYRAHVASSTAPKPLSAREKEMEAVRAAERNSEAISSASRKTSHLDGGVVGVQWSDEVREAVDALGKGEGSENLIIVDIDMTSTEIFRTVSRSTTTLEELPNALPSEASYGIFAWDHTPTGTSASKRDILCIYICPPSSPVKTRMVYSASVAAFMHIAKSQYGLLFLKRIEVSEPKELDVGWIKREYDGDAGNDKGVVGNTDEKKAFARPKGPGRKR